MWLTYVFSDFSRAGLTQWRAMSPSRRRFEETDKCLMSTSEGGIWWCGAKRRISECEARTSNPSQDQMTKNFIWSDLPVFLLQYILCNMTHVNRYAHDKRQTAYLLHSLRSLTYTCLQALNSSQNFKPPHHVNAHCFVQEFISDCIQFIFNQKVDNSQVYYSEVASGAWGRRGDTRFV